MALLAAGGLCSAFSFLGAGVALKWGNDSAHRARKLRDLLQPKNLAELKAEFYTAPFEAAIRGRARSAQPLLGDVTKREAVILHLVKDQVNEKRTSPAGTPAKHETWEQEKRQLSDETREAQWSISNGPAEVPIVNGWAAADASGVIQRTANELVPTPEGQRDREKEKRVGERCIGVQVQERMLPVETTLTVLGTIEQEPTHKWSRSFQGAIREGNSLLVMHPKEFSTKTVSELINEADDNAYKWRVVAGVAAALGSSLLLGTAVNMIKKRGQQ